MMAISKEAFKVLESIVGSRYISDDPVICEGYRCGPGGYECGLGYERVMTKVPGAVIVSGIISSEKTAVMAVLVGTPVVGPGFVVTGRV